MIAECVGVACCCIWVYLIAARGDFWRVPKAGNRETFPKASAPRIAVVVPARNEADVVSHAISSLLMQDYSGPLQIVVVDDHSSDTTPRLLSELAARHEGLLVMSSQPLPCGWTGKMWALSQGIAATTTFRPDYFLFSDADIVHSPNNLSSLVSVAEARSIDLLSQVPRLSCSSLAERALIPAFVFYFFMLYPPKWVENAKRGTAAAAGGNVLIRADALAKIGGIAAIQNELIDDCALARAVKRIGSVEIGWSNSARSIRVYGGFREIGRMISRNAFRQLRHSLVLLIASLTGLAITFILPPVLAFSGGPAAAFGIAAWVLMSVAFWPTLRFYSLPLLWAPLLPLTTLFYAGATIYSAMQYWLGCGGEWKGRRQDRRSHEPAAKAYVTH